MKEITRTTTHGVGL